VTPVSEIDGYSFEVGPVIRQLVEDYDRLVHSFEDSAASAA
jgi:hypothetical protein